ncbi:MAG: PAS domain-containing protein [Candidatus Magnetominusculus sp. LBB02]|nr:PAS domain-containing protein [Candidatus Magnetominusculus sp. LBB02]
MAEGKLFYNRLYDRLTDVFFQTDTDGRVMFISDSIGRLTGFSLDEIKLRGMFRELFADPGQAAGFIDSLNEKESAEDVELLMKTHSGVPLWVSVSAYYFRDNGSPTIGGTARDITKYKECRDDYELLRQRCQKTAGLAHELNNQLTAASLNIQIISQRLDSSSRSEAITQKLETLQRNIDNAVSMAKQMLAIPVADPAGVSFAGRYIG